MNKENNFLTQLIINEGNGGIKRKKDQTLNSPNRRLKLVNENMDVSFTSLHIKEPTIVRNMPTEDSSEVSMGDTIVITEERVSVTRCRFIHVKRLARAKFQNLNTLRHEDETSESLVYNTTMLTAEEAGLTMPSHSS